MRERRWETPDRLTFREVLAVGDRLGALGLKPAQPTKDVICYVEDWAVDSPAEFDRLDHWATEDVTLLHVREGWQGDFFLLAGGYHTVYQHYQDVGTYCSISHPWRTNGPLRFHHPTQMLWLGFRHNHAFIRVRLYTREVVTPGETREDARRGEWIDERRTIFLDAIALLDLPIETSVDKGNVLLTPEDPATPFFCSWPDAFGPCQFEYNSSDAYEFLVPASKLAATFAPQAAGVRAYLTGFSEAALEKFSAVQPGARSLYRCSVHCALGELPDVLETIEPQGRLYSTLCEFQTQELMPDGEEASAIIGVVGNAGGFQLEARLNRASLPEDHMAGWLERLLGYPVVYAPLPPFL
ncbi:MAG: hypothetical protein OJF47_002393 [Nitrospira sp.]|nr:MAG: hypothetical protein OJF47_002393 [Nitrospira sp.]